MKTAKQEAIEKAYGEHWDIVGKHVDGDGYLHHPKGGEVTFEPFIGFMDEHPTKDAYRPKSLSCIETNNGWIRIESEEDLPNDAGYCDCIIDGDLSEVCFYWESEQSFTDAAGHMIKPSHYIMKTKPTMPVY